MIAHLTGVLRDKDGTGCVVDCHGMGFGVDLSLASLAALGQLGSPCSLFIHTHVAEDQLRLFGFVTVAERRAFVALIGASGVGPRLALTILSTLSPGELANALAERDHVPLVRVPGIGKKKAERILLELDGKLAAGGEAAAAGTREAPSSPDGQSARLLADVTSALVHLGFAAQEAEPAARDALTNGSIAGHDVAGLVRRALQQLTPR